MATVSHKFLSIDLMAYWKFGLIWKMLLFLVHLILWQLCNYVACCVRILKWFNCGLVLYNLQYHTLQILNESFPALNHLEQLSHNWRNEWAGRIWLVALVDHLSMSISKIDCCFKLMCLNLQSKHDLKGKDQLLSLIRKFPEGLAVVDVKDSYPSVMDDLQVLLKTKLWILLMVYTCILIN